MASSSASSTSSNNAARASVLVSPLQLLTSCDSNSLSPTGNSLSSSPFADSSSLSLTSPPDVPQWKRDLIQRRRQQQQQAGKLISARSTSTSATTTTTSSYSSIAGGFRGGVGLAISSLDAAALLQRVPAAPASPTEDATTFLLAAATARNSPSCTVVPATTEDSSDNMRLEVPDVTPLSTVDGDDLHNRAKCKGVLDIVELAKMRTSNTGNNNKQQDDCESDSSEELQYGPGIVHKLRSKYLNMTLKEMNKNRTNVQCFRRATSLEDLLDHKDGSLEKTRRYAKKNVTGAAAKVERYRNAARGNESMKRARSVEALMRCNSAPEETQQPQQNHTSRVVSSVFKQENDHIILVDRTAVKIENRLLDKDRLKPVNKPKRIKPVLAETERPPPDLVKTTMRIFESSLVKKLKPKGEVAVKVATFKTINDTFKAQNQKKIIPKPPLQSKPFVNGNSKITTSPRKIILTRKSTAELIEKQNSQESYHNEGVLTAPIVSSVSSVVSKFQQIEKTYSPSSSPEPSKIKFSPIPSPEPSAVKAKVSSLDLKSPTATIVTLPIPSPRTTPPKLLSPMFPKMEIPTKQPSIFVPRSNSTSLTSKFEQSKLSPLSSEIAKIDFPEQNKDEPSTEQVTETILELNNQSSTETISDVAKLSDSASSLESTVLIESFDESGEAVVDSPRTVSKCALDNISKAGMTVQFSFNDNPIVKSYLPRPAPTSQSTEDSFECDLTSPKLVECSTRLKSPSTERESTSTVSETITSPFEPPREKVQLQADGSDETIFKEEQHSSGENKPIGAISSLSLIKSTTTTTYSQGNESKTIRSQKSESNSPPQKQIGIIRPLVSTKTQLPQQNLSNREIEKNLINRVKSIEQPTKVVVSLKSAEEIQPVKKNNNSSSGGGLWDSKPWNQQNNTMVFNFSNRKDVPDYIENDGLIVKRKRDKPRQHQQQQEQQQQSDESDVIVSNIDSLQLTDDSDSECSLGPPSPCDISFCNDNVLINGRSNLSRTPRNHKHRIQFDDTATRTFEYPSEASMLEADGTGLMVGSNSSVDGKTSASDDVAAAAGAARPSGTLPSLLGGGGLANYTPSKVDLASEGFELGITRASMSTLALSQSANAPSAPQQQQQIVDDAVDYLKPSQDPGTWGQETAADMLY